MVSTPFPIEILLKSYCNLSKDLAAFGGNFTKILVTLGSGGVRRSSWALECVEFHGESISDTSGTIPRDLGGHILKKTENFRYFPQKMRYANLQVSTTLIPTVV